jgi:L-alanine-DL-glutamate epimerase-like enolase superfamily enzyme
LRLEVERRSYRFRTPMTMSFGTLGARDVLIVAVTDDDGYTGYGEAAPLEPYDGVSLETVGAALETYERVLRKTASLAPGDRLLALRDAADVPQALAALDMAFWDRRGKRDGVPVCDLLSSSAAARVPVNATLGALDRAGAAAAASAARAAGFQCVKVKVGVGDDAGRVAAVRAAAGPEMALRLDANGAWATSEAVQAIAALDAAGLELVEEPVHGLENLRAVRERVPVRIAMDETASRPGALLSGAADAVCLKIAASGGISSLLADAVAVRTTGADVYLGSTFDGPLGIAAAVHAAAALAPMPPCGLATLGLFEGFDGVLPVRAGAIDVPTGPGLGVDPP